MNSVRNRLALLIFVITAAAVGFIYLYVVPQLRSSLTAEKLRRLEQGATEQSPRLQRALGDPAPQARLNALLGEIDQRAGARVTVLGVRPGPNGPEPAFVVADSELDRTAVTGDYPAAAAAALNGTLASAVERVGGERIGETAIALGPRSEPPWAAVF